MAVVLMPLPQLDFDPTEVAASWAVLTQHGRQVIFATPTGATARGDELMLTGEGLDPWGWVPGLRRVVIVQDGLYLSARWPGDVHTFAARFAALLDGAGRPQADASAVRSRPSAAGAPVAPTSVT